MSSGPSSARRLGLSNERLGKFRIRVKHTDDRSCKSAVYPLNQSWIHPFGSIWMLDMVALDRPKAMKVKTRLLILGAARDDMLRPGEIEATARAYHTRCEIIPDVAHNSMLEARWETVAERILMWLREAHHSA